MTNRINISSIPLNEEVNEIAKINDQSGSFDFLADEPELYAPSDLKINWTNNRSVVFSLETE